MKAERFHTFGGAEVICLEDIPKPKPKANELLVSIRAAGVNPVDWKIREGSLGQPPLPAVPGSDFAGVVEVIGPGVKEFSHGDEVFGDVAEESGSYAEYAIAPVAQVTRRPFSLDPVQAAALPTASLAAWQALFDVADLQPGQRILIHAAAGGVGGFAVQFACWKGAHVIATASAQNAAYVRELGAHEVINHQAVKFEQALREVDIVLDTVGDETQERSWNVLKPGGILVSVVQRPSIEKAAAHGVQGVFHRVQQSRPDELARIADLVVRREIRVNVETVLPLAEAPRARELSRGGHTRGKIVLQVKWNQPEFQPLQAAD